MKTYQRAWRLYLEYSSITTQKSPTLPLPENSIVLFVSYLNLSGYSSASITTYLSALSYLHRINNIPDPVATHLVQKTLVAIQKMDIPTYSRSPITITLLSSISQNVKHNIGSVYLQHLLRAMYLTSFFGFFRVGEISVSKDQNHTLQLNNVQISEKTVKINMTSYKHSAGKTASLTLHRQNNVTICPVLALNEYSKRRPKVLGPLFVFENGSPVTSDWYAKQFGIAISYLGLDPKKYQTHSMRVGAASFAAACGFSDSQIRALGRWRSDAFKKYIKELNTQSPALEANCASSLSAPWEPCAGMDQR